MDEVKFRGIGDPKVDCPKSPDGVHVIARTRCNRSGACQRPSDTEGAKDFDLYHDLMWHHSDACEYCGAVIK